MRTQRHAPGGGQGYGIIADQWWLYIHVDRRTYVFKWRWWV